MSPQSKSLGLAMYAVKVNPESKVPALDIDGKIITESLVIIELINDLFPEKNLLPKDPFQRAQIRFATEFFASKVWSQFFPVLQAKITKEEFLEQVEPALTRLNGLLLEQSQTGPYFLGDQFSLADIALGPFVARILATASLFEKENLFQFNAVKQNPRLAEFFKGVVSRPSFKDTYLGDQLFIDLINKRFSPKF
ncbi:hypothetical protein [Absidia glauca]|uniref:GST C-terminal domain-containing protein n=1 Tax=Absidia glauca TaxID=4829 RepID=A0A163JFS5_ABSGL|nr:hypothetical protein [Absidia glauca]